MASVSVPQSTSSGEFAWQVIDTSERVTAFILLVIVSPVLIAAAATIGATSRRSPLIAHRRVGFRGKPLWMWKLRTMWSPGDPASWHWIEYVHDDLGSERKHPADSRVGNWFARFCRRHSIDEIPQLWHVIRGEMALVGPRPITDAEIRTYYGRHAYEVLQVKPGITGLWQASGRNRLTYAERRRLDLLFVRSRTPGMYLRILRQTLTEIWTAANSY